MNDDDFAPFGLAVKLKEKGFDAPCYGYYHCNGGNDSFELCGNGDRDFLNSKNRYRIAAPTIPQVLKWLREEYHLHISSNVYSDYSTDADLNVCDEWSFWSYYIASTLNGFFIYAAYQHVDCVEYQRWEDAALAGIEYCLDNLI